MVLPACVLLSASAMLLCTKNGPLASRGHLKGRKCLRNAALQPKAQLCRPAAKLQRGDMELPLSAKGCFWSLHLYIKGAS